MYTKAFHIVINPTGSLFAKTLQNALKQRVTNKVFRSSYPKLNRQCFQVTTNVLNKIEQLTRFKDNDVVHPGFTTDRNCIGELESKSIFARTLINSTNGRGIVEFDRGEQQNIPNAPLYVAYIPKKAEYRVHVFNGQVIDVQQKKKKRDADERNHRIRNVNNGYVYCRMDIAPPDGLADLAIRACQACGYFYGAVDVIYNEKRNQCYVLEVNSRPGLMGTTIEKYAEAIINTYDLNRKENV